MVKTRSFERIVGNFQQILSLWEAIALRSLVCEKMLPFPRCVHTAKHFLIGGRSFVYKPSTYLCRTPSNARTANRNAAGEENIFSRGHHPPFPPVNWVALFKTLNQVFFQFLLPFMPSLFFSTTHSQAQAAASDDGNFCALAGRRRRKRKFSSSKRDARKKYYDDNDWWWNLICTVKEN